MPQGFYTVNKMNSYTKQLIKVGDIFYHLTNGDLYELMSIEDKPKLIHRKLSRPPERTGPVETVYTFLDIKTGEKVEYTWAMFRDRLKFASHAAKVLYAPKIQAE